MMKLRYISTLVPSFISDNNVLYVAPLFGQNAAFFAGLL